MKKFLPLLIFLPMIAFGFSESITRPKITHPYSIITTQQYPNYYQSVEARYLVSSNDWTSDGANGSISIQNNYLDVYFDSAWDYNQTIATGVIASLNIYPALPNIELGQIYGNGQETGYYAKIEDNNLVIYAVNPVSSPYFSTLYFGLSVDLNCAVNWYRDLDGDGYGDPNSIAVTDCYQPSSTYVTNNLDCDDQNHTITVGQNWYLDSDNDGFGDYNSSPISSCLKPWGNYVTNNLDTCPNSYSTTSNGCPQNPALVNENYIHTITPTTPTTNLNSLNNNEKTETIAYFDGLGRPLQNIGIRASETKDPVTGEWIFKDLITPVEYDAFGRQVKDYLPYASTSNGGLYRSSALTDIIPYYSNDPKYEYTQNPYSEKKYEASPLDRVLKQAAPGNDWQLDNGHEIKFDYQTNKGDEVKNFEVVFANDIYNPTLTQNPVNNGFYNAKELYKTLTYDENTTANPIDETSGSTVEFKNKQGQVVLKRTYGTVGTGLTNENHDTYYIYDDLGNLSYVLPPKMESTTASITTINNQLNDLSYQYKYDQRNRLVEKKLPGKQWEFIVYDKLDRVVATGPVLSPFNDTAAGAVGWIITKYDVFSRPVYTGWEQSTTVNSDGRIIKQTVQNSATVFNESKQTSGTIDNITVYYSNTISPTDFKLLTVNYYDNYDFPGVAGIPSVVETQNVLNTASAVKGLATGSWIRVPITLFATQSEITTTFYDSKARPIRTHSTNFLGGYTFTDSKLDFIGKQEYTITYHKRILTDTELKTKEVFTYSPQGRLENQTHQINDGAVELIANNSYDELGQLITKEVAGNTQKVNYTYNIRGWLKGINDISGLQQGSDPKDLFAFKINYNSIPSGISGVNALYNGNIAETQWATNSDNGVVRTYGYKYDNLNRLRAGIYKKESTVTDLYNESMDYDKNGNIMHLRRYGSLDDSNQTLIDNLTYNYLNSNTTNQLLSVDDAISNNPNFANEFKNTVGNDYSYDANGNMLTDANKGITTNIVYNHLNLPTKITFGAAGNIIYIYNASGQKVQKIVTQGGTTTTTDYLGGYQYKDNDLKFFPTAEGYVEHSGSSYKYIYQYKDHLGNVRLSYDKSLVVQEENDYYPFGLKHTGYGYGQVLNSDYKYKYQGQERQDELGLNWDSFKYRNYDMAIGRFMSIDPLSEDYPYNSTYAFQENKMGMGTELEGKELRLHDWLTIDSAVNPNGVGAHTIGIGEGLMNSAKGLWNAVSNPVETAKGIGNTALWLAVGSQGSQAVDNALGTNATGAGNSLLNSVVSGGDKLINGSGTERGSVIGEFAGAAIGAKGASAVMEGVSGLSKVSNVSPNVQNALNTLKDIKANGGTVKVNPMNPSQELNMTIKQGAQKLDLRVESHKLPAKYGGDGVNPTRHMNVDIKGVNLPDKGHKKL